MADVISGFGVAASFLQAVHNLLESSKVVSSFVHRVKDAHNKLQRLNSKLSLVQALLESLSQFLEINIKNDIIPPESEPRLHTSTRFKTPCLALPLKSVFRYINQLLIRAHGDTNSVFFNVGFAVRKV
jgi:hypothetical protein